MSIHKPQDSDDNMPIRVRPLKKSIRKIQNNGYHIPNPIKSFINSTDRRIMNSRHNYRLGNDLFVFAALYGTARKNRITPSFKSKIDLGKIFEIPILPDPAVPAKEKVKDFQKLIRSLNHRPFDSSSDGHKLFHEKRIEELDKLIQKYPEANFSKYRIYFS